MEQQQKAKRAVATRVALIAVLTAAVALVLVKRRRAHALVIQTVADIEAELDSLPPLERAATVARLGSDAVKHVRTDPS